MKEELEFSKGAPEELVLPEEINSPSTPTEPNWLLMKMEVDKYAGKLGKLHEMKNIFGLVKNAWELGKERGWRPEYIELYNDAISDFELAKKTFNKKKVGAPKKKHKPHEHHSDFK